MPERGEIGGGEQGRLKGTRGGGKEYREGAAHFYACSLDGVAIKWGEAECS